MLHFLRQALLTAFQEPPMLELENAFLCRDSRRPVRRFPLQIVPLDGTKARGSSRGSPMLSPKCIRLNFLQKQSLWVRPQLVARRPRQLDAKTASPAPARQWVLVIGPWLVALYAGEPQVDHDRADVPVFELDSAFRSGMAAALSQQAHCSGANGACVKTYRVGAAFGIRDLHNPRGNKGGLRACAASPAPSGGQNHVASFEMNRVS